VTDYTVRELSSSALEDNTALLDKIVAAQVALEPPGFFGDPTGSDLREATRAGLDAVLACLAGKLPVEEAAEQARSAGRRQMQQNLPLEGVLRAYRVAGVELWDAYVAAVRQRGGRATEQLLDSARELWTVIDAFSAAVSEGYRSEESLLRSRDDLVQASLLAALLDGRGAEPVFARDAATALGLNADEKLVCLVGIAPEAGSTAFEAPKERLRTGNIASVWRGTADGECGLVVLGRRTVDEARRLLLPTVRGRAGMSPVFTELADLPRMQRLAGIAARCSPAPRRIAEVSENLPAALVWDSPLVADLLWSRTVGILLDKAGADGPALLETVRAFLAAEASLNTAAAASYVHRNTMKYRLNKAEKLTGVSLVELSGQVQWSLGLLSEDLRRR
jgi:hypothetical protein